MITSKISNYIGSSEKSKLEDYVKDADKDIKSLFLALQRRIRFGDGTDGNSENISGEFITVSAAGANAEFAVTHTLGSTPIGFIVVKPGTAGVMYDSGTTWTDSTIYLKNSVANTTATLFLLK